jgi:hypothetical protein
LVVAVVALLAGAAACGGGGGGGGDDDPAAGDPATDDADAAGGEEAAPTSWEKIVPAGDCECADGSEFAFWVREADPAKVVFFLEGGGACFDAESCAFSGDGGGDDGYNWKLGDEFPGRTGMFDFTRSDNPFADYTVVYVPLCTGDGYLGDVTREYTPELTVEHKGFVNGTAALGYLAEQFPDAAQVAVVGKTAGSVAAPVYGGLVADLLPDAQVTVLGAQSGSIPNDTDLVAQMVDAWGASDTMPDWSVNEGLTAADWRPTRFWVQAGLHDPDITMARFDYAFDANAGRTLAAMGLDPATAVDVMDANEATIEDAGVTQHSYTAPGDDHGLFEFDAFYDLEVEDVMLTDWLTELLAGDAPADVHCSDCDPP